VSLPRRGGYRQRAEDLVETAFSHAWTPTEDEFTELFLDIATRAGWTFRAHVHDSRRMDLRSTPGLPDWFMVNPAQKRTAWFELKGFAGKASDEQRAFIAAINDAGGEAYLVATTGDYPRDAAAIAELLGPGWRR
jgi:hypothetical protein